MNTNRSLKVFGVVAILNAGFLLISNLIASKIWSFCGLPFDAGIILFPILYILGDIANEILGKQLARWITLVSLVLNVVAILVFKIALALPVYPGWMGQMEFELVFNVMPRVLAASLCAYLVSSLVDILLFSKIQSAQTDPNKQFYARALGSSVVSRLVDSLIFEILAFYGVLPFKEFVIQAFSAYAAAMLLETILFPLTYSCTHLCKMYISGKSLFSVQKRSSSHQKNSMPTKNNPPDPRFGDYDGKH